MFVKPVVGSAKRRAMVFVSRTMKAVRSAFRHQADLRARRPSRIRIGVAGGDPELLQRVQSRTDGAGKGYTLQLVVIVDTVERHTSLVAASAIHRAASAVNLGVCLASNSVGTPCEHHPGLEAENADRIAALKGKRVDLVCAKRVTQRGILRIHKFCCPADL